MFPLTDASDQGARLISGLIKIASSEGRGLDTMRMTQYMAGILVETALLFDKPDEALNGSLQALSVELDADPVLGELGAYALPPAHVIDLETERGREAARDLFEECLECEYAFHELIIGIVSTVITSWENVGQGRAETLRLVIECAFRAMAFEISAQELCDIMIDVKIAKHEWTINDCVAGLSAMSGLRLGLSTSAEFCMMFSGSDLPGHLDDLSCVMTAEAVRLGVPAGSDWRFGLPANDVPPSPPHDLIEGVDHICSDFFEAINLQCAYDQAVATAKAAGRMLAVAAGGKCPEIEPVIAKPLAMSAISESYKSVCMDLAAVSY